MDPQTRQDVKYKTQNLISTVNEKLDIGSAKFKGDDTSKLDVAVLKATSSEDVVPKEKHVVTLKSACGPSSGQRMHYVIQTLAQRLESHKGKWLVTLKALIVFHRLQRETDPSFSAELLRYAERTSTRRMLRLDTFADHTTKETWDYSAWVRVYSVYLDERMDVFRVMQFDPVQDESAPTKLKACSSSELLERMPLAHKLLSRLIACVPEGAAGHNPVVVQACGLVLKEVRSVYRLVCEAVMNLCDKFFEMDRTEAFQGLELYKENVALNDRLNVFFSSINKVGTMKGSVTFPTLQSLPADFLTTMEEYARDAPRVLDPSDTTSGRGSATKAPADMKSSSLAKQGGTTSGALAGEPGAAIATLPIGTLKIGGPIAPEAASASSLTGPSSSAPAATGPAPAPSFDLLGDSFLHPSSGSGPAHVPAPATGAAPLQTVDSFFGGAWMAPGASGGQPAGSAGSGSVGGVPPTQQQQQQGFGGPSSFSSNTEAPPAPSAYGGYGGAPAYPGAAPQQHQQQGFPGAAPGGYPGAPYGGAPNPYAAAPNPYGQPAPGPNPYGAPGANPYGSPAPNPYTSPVPGPNPYGAPPGGSNPFTTGFGAPAVAGSNPFSSPAGLGGTPPLGAAPAAGAAPAWDPKHDPLSNLSIDILGKPSGYVAPPPTLKQLGQARPAGQ